MNDDDTPIYIQMDPRGRPLKYSDYKLERLARSLNKWVDQGIKDNKSFLLGDWCVANNVIPQKLRFYSERNRLLKKAYERAKAFQEHMISKGALFRKLDPKMSTFMLTCLHGWDAKGTSNQQTQQPLTVIHYGSQDQKQCQTNQQIEEYDDEEEEENDED